MFRCKDRAVSLCPSWYGSAGGSAGGSVGGGSAAVAAGGRGTTPSQRQVRLHQCSLITRSWFYVVFTGQRTT
jgi:hypothetical protein